MFSAYETHDAYKSMLRTQFNFAAAGMSVMANAMRLTALFSPIPKSYETVAQNIDASITMMDRAVREYKKPAFNLNKTSIDGAAVNVRETIVAKKPFGQLLHFKRDTNRNDPKVLIVTPMSGHFATLLRDTVATLLPSHDVYVVDWENARDVPPSAGRFGLDEYNSYVQDFMSMLGPHTHVLAVCQPTVPVLAAVSVMAKRDDANQPMSMTLMAGPIDTRVNETEVNRTAKKHPIAWFERLTTEVSSRYAGWHRKVYPGFVQLFSFMSMNTQRHIDAHTDMFHDLRTGKTESAKKKTDFYDEYLATEDMTAEFYLETVHKVFQTHELPRGKMKWNGETIDPRYITKTALLTVEGAKDDICGRGQTEAAQRLCSGLKPDQKYHYVQEGAGHYGTFNGARWQNGIAPRFSIFIREIAERQGIKYTPAAAESRLGEGPKQWDPAKMVPELRAIHYADNDNRQRYQPNAGRVLNR